MQHILTTKRIISLQCLLSSTLILGLLSYSNLSFADWEMVGESPLSEGQTASIDLALNPQGIPYVAFRDSNLSSGKAIVMKLENDTWQKVGTKNLSEGQADFIDLAIDRKGTPYVAYRDFASGKGVTVKKLVNQDWQVVGNQNLSGGEARFISLALDQTGIPYVAYQDLENEGRATVKKLSPKQGWEVVGTNPLSPKQASFISLALNYDNVPYVAYADWGQGGTQQAVLKKLTDQQWETVGKGYFSEQKAAFIHLAFDYHNTPYITYRDSKENEKVTVQRLKMDHWETVGEPNISGCKAFPFSLVLDQDGTPYVAYQCSERNWGYYVYVKRFYNESWNVAFTSSSPAKYPNLAFDNHKKLLYAAFSDNKASVIKREFSPEIEVLGGRSLVSISHNDEVPVPEKGTYFKASLGQSVTHNFVLSNNGDLNLMLQSNEPLHLSPDCGAFQISQPSSATINSLEFSTFKVTFTPTQATSVKCTLSILNNSRRDPYSFTILGVGTTEESVSSSLKVSDLGPSMH